MRCPIPERAAFLAQRLLLAGACLLPAAWPVLAQEAPALPDRGASTVSEQHQPDARQAAPAVEAARAAEQAGAFLDAAVKWQEAAKAFEQSGDAWNQTQALIRLAHALQRLGEHRKAALALQAALERAKAFQHQPTTATILARLGLVSVALGREPEGLQALQEAVQLARDSQNAELTATLLNDWGNALAGQERFAEALAAFGEAERLAATVGQRSLMTTARINSAWTALDDHRLRDAKERLDLATEDLSKLPDGHDKAFAWLNLGRAYAELLTQSAPRPAALPSGASVPSGGRGVTTVPESSTAPAGAPPEPGAAPPAFSELERAEITRTAAAAYWSAGQLADQQRDARLQSYAWGYLGHLYERQARYAEALELTRRATLESQKSGSAESLYRWHWQTGRLLRALGKADEAVQAYRRAITVVQPIRQELATGYRARTRSFRESIGPLFFEYADLLLRGAAQAPDQAKHAEFLQFAQDAIEGFKAAELQDYFKDECVATAQARSTAMQVDAKTTVVLYPIVLPDRLELLVSLPEGLKQYVVPVTAVQLTETVRALRLELMQHTTQAFLPHAQQLYDWLVRPLEKELARSTVTTLVVVPDGALRTIPLSTLHDGQRFLIQRYAVATTPGLLLTDPRPIDRSRVQVLALGLSKSVQGFPPLPYVAQEVDTVKSLYAGKVLFDEDFQVPNVERELKEHPFNVVHVASHGKLEPDVRNSFLLAFDDKITMDRLSQLIGVLQFRQTPLDLLTLSACETAAGDDRAALGLAGVAIKAGARSALATLWLIDDEATADLIAEFYHQLRNPLVSKAAALQRAQLKVMREAVTAHPYFWAPFLLINNWL